MAILDDLDFIKEDTLQANELRTIVTDLLTAFLDYQGEDGMWYQVIDKNKADGNWPETSCTCLFTAAICKALRNNIISENKEEFMNAAKKAYEAVIKTLSYDENGDVQIGGVCIGTGVGDYEYYINRPTSVNDLHGVGAFLLMCSEMEQLS